MYTTTRCNTPGPIFHAKDGIAWCPEQQQHSEHNQEVGNSTTYPKAVSWSPGTHRGAGGEGEHPQDSRPPLAGCCLPSGSFWKSLSILLATCSGSVPNQTPKEQQKCYGQSNSRLKGAPNTAGITLTLTQVGEYCEFEKQRGKKGDLVAVTSFPTRSWP